MVGALYFAPKNLCMTLVSGSADAGIGGAPCAADGTDPGQDPAASRGPAPSGAEPGAAEPGVADRGTADRGTAGLDARRTTPGGGNTRESRMRRTVVGVMAPDAEPAVSLKRRSTAVPEGASLADRLAAAADPAAADAGGRATVAAAGEAAAGAVEVVEAAPRARAPAAGGAAGDIDAEDARGDDTSAPAAPAVRSGSRVTASLGVDRRTVPACGPKPLAACGP